METIAQVMIGVGMLMVGAGTLLLVIAVLYDTYKRWEDK